METLLAVTIQAARAAGLIKKASLNRIIVDTTVMPKAIAHRQPLTGEKPPAPGQAR